MSETAAKISVVHFADPWCFWSWGLEPLLQRLRVVYGASLEIVYRMGGMSDDFRGWQRTYEVDDQGTIDWIKSASAKTGHPQDPRFMLRAGLESTSRSCQAVKAAELQDTHKAERYFRRLMEVFQVEARSPTDAVLLDAAGDVGLDRDKLAADLDADACRAAFAEDQRLMRVMRASFLALVISAGGKTVSRSGLFVAAPVEQLIDELAPGLPRHRPTNILEHLAGLRGHLVHTREVAEVFQINDRDADARLGELAAAGLIDRRTFDFGHFWVPTDRTTAQDAPAAALLT